VSSEQDHEENHTEEHNDGWLLSELLFAEEMLDTDSDVKADEEDSPN